MPTSRQLNFLRKQLITRVDFNTEEFLGRRIMRGLGLNSNADLIESVKFKLQNSTCEEKQLDTVWDVSCALLMRVLDMNGQLPLYRRFFAVSVKNKAEAAERLAEFTGTDYVNTGCVVFYRLGTKRDAQAFVAFLLPCTEWCVLKPPFTVEAHERGDVGIIHQDVVRFVSQFGPFSSTLADIMIK